MIRELNPAELGMVSGGASPGAAVGAIMAVVHEGGVAGALVGGAFFAGYGLGIGINAAWAGLTGKSIGSSIYDAINS